MRLPILIPLRTRGDKSGEAVPWMVSVSQGIESPSERTCSRNCVTSFKPPRRKIGTPTIPYSIQIAEKTSFPGNRGDGKYSFRRSREAFSGRSAGLKNRIRLPATKEFRNVADAPRNVFAHPFCSAPAAGDESRAPIAAVGRFALSHVSVRQIARARLEHGGDPASSEGKPCHRGIGRGPRNDASTGSCPAPTASPPSFGSVAHSRGHGGHHGEQQLYTFGTGVCRLRSFKR